MECPNCKTSNPNENRFCGACSAPLTEEIVDVQAFIRDEFPRQIERAIDTKLLALTDREVVEVKATEQVINRAWTWVTRFATVLGIPVVVVATILGFFGFTTITDLKRLHSEVNKAHKEALATAAKMENDVNDKINEADIKFATLDAQIKMANESVKNLDGLHGEMNNLSGNFFEQLENMKQELGNITVKVEKVDGKVNNANIKIENVEGDVGDVKDEVGNVELQVKDVDGKLGEVQGDIGDVLTKVKDVELEIKVEKEKIEETEAVNQKVGGANKL